MWDYPPPRQMQSSYAGTVVSEAGTALGARLSPAAAGEHVLPVNNAWNQSAPIAAAHGGSSFLSLLGARNVTLPEMFEAVPVACDYLTGLGAAAAGVVASSNMGGDAAYSLGNVDRYSAASVPAARHGTARSPLVYSGDSVVHGISSAGCAPRYDHEVKGGSSQQQGFGAPTAAVLQQMIPSRVEIQSALGFPSMGSERERLTESFGVGSLPDGSSFGDSWSAAEFMSGNNNTHEQDVRPGMGSSSSGSGASSVATRRKSEERVGGNAKKSKQKASHKASPPKTQPEAPKVKLGEKITTLQQIVSPFGKTDTSSVLFETIKYIKFLHEQLRLFSEPYTTRSAHKGHILFGGEEVEEKTGTGHGLRGRGLCLVPISLTSQVYHDDTLPDCLTPAYRSCLYTGR